MTENKLSQHLWNEANVSGHEDLIFEQYKLCVEMADRISSRRDTANAFFLTLNSIFFGTAASFVDKINSIPNKWMLILPLSVLLLQSFFWWRLIISYKQLNSAKFQVISELEQKLPAAPYGRAEWTYLLKEGKDRNVYWPLTHLESKIPWIFFLGYILFFGFVIFK